jgi:hypothetical protein
MPYLVTSVSLSELIKHTASWLRNLHRASKERKKESIDALRGVITAARKTAVYVRQLNKKRQRHFATENELSSMWTSLSFRLYDLGLHQLVKKCDLKGRHWASPELFDDDFLQQADISLDTMEKLAKQILKGLVKKNPSKK